MLLRWSYDDASHDDDKLCDDSHDDDNLFDDGYDNPDDDDNDEMVMVHGNMSQMVAITQEGRPLWKQMYGSNQIKELKLICQIV